jgi:hypothetical protein
VISPVKIKEERICERGEVLIFLEKERWRGQRWKNQR